jgi:hypothetical protein
VLQAALIAAGLVLQHGCVAAERPEQAMAAGVGEDQAARHPPSNQPTQPQQAHQHRIINGAALARSPAHYGPAR